MTYRKNDFLHPGQTMGWGRSFALGLAMAGMVVGLASVAQAEPEGSDAGEEPLALLLYWKQDPTTTMLVDWQSMEEVDEPGLEFRLRGTEEWSSATGSTHPFPFSDRFVHRVELTGLEPATEYDFRLADDGRVYFFRTMPADARRPVRFVTGGDTLHRQEWMEQTNRVAMEYDPEFFLWGGDLAYADGMPDRVDRWYQWFDAIMNTMITEEGRVVPAIVAIGNHEVGNHESSRYFYFNYPDYEPTDEFRAQIAPYFFGLFAFPGQPGYNVLDFGDYMSFVILDTDHANAIGGVQTEWLEEMLEARQHIPHVFPVQHVAGFPSNRAYDHQVPVRMREHWMPLYEKYNIRVVFENHDHTYKRTPPIRGEQIDPNGVVYIGDGAWGVGARPVHSPDETWYLDRAESLRHFILVTVHGNQQHFLVVDEDGRIIDEYPETFHSKIER